MNKNAPRNSNAEPHTSENVASNVSTHEQTRLTSQGQPHTTFHDTHVVQNVSVQVAGNSGT